MTYRIHRDGPLIASIGGDRIEYEKAPQAPLEGELYHQVTALNQLRGESFPAPLWRCSLHAGSRG